jgi:hypothetical protein
MCEGMAVGNGVGACAVVAMWVGMGMHGDDDANVAISPRLAHTR